MKGEVDISIKQALGLDVFNGLVKLQARRHELRQLFWECTQRCNMKCRHCGSDCKFSSDHKDMPFEDFEKVLVRLCEVYNPNDILIIVSGGEPLMREDIVDVGGRISTLGYPWGMVSNGRLMSDTMIRNLVGAGMKAVSISLDGLEEEHNWMRGNKESFRYASHAIETLAGQPVAFDVVTCVYGRNFTQLDRIREHLIGMGVRQWRLLTVFPVGRAASDPELQLSHDQKRALMDFIVATRKEGRIKASFGCEGFLGGYEMKVRDHFFTCQAGISVASVRIDGAISACTSVRADYDQGNIYSDDFVDVWENRFADMRDRGWARTGDCAKCRYWKWCHGDGLHLRDSEGRLLQCTMRELGLIK